MRIPCPCCGPRDAREFTYRGDATVSRPDPGTSSPEDWYTYVYARKNPPGIHREYWHHVNGCRQWLIVTRNVTTHEILGAELAGAWGTPKQEDEAV